MASLTQLEYIVAVEKLRHFGKAAQLCHVTQPTLSMQIQKVEEEIGYLLFDRLKKPVVATAKGAKFIAQAKVLLHEHHKLLELSRRQNATLSGEFRLGVIPTLAPYLLPLFIESFSREYPEVNLFIDELKTDMILGMLGEDQLDAGLLATPLNEPGLKERPLFNEPFYLYVAKGHPLHARKRIREEDLRGEDMWLLEDGHCFRTQIERYCAVRNRASVYPNVKFAGGNIDTLRNLVRKSQGYTLVPALFVETLSEAERRECVREIERPTPVREVSLIYRKDHWKKDILESLAQTITKQLPARLRDLDPRRQEVIGIR